MCTEPPGRDAYAGRGRRHGRRFDHAVPGQRHHALRRSRRAGMSGYKDMFSARSPCAAGTTWRVGLRLITWTGLSFADL